MRIRAVALSLALLGGSASLPARATGEPPRVPCRGATGTRLEGSGSGNRCFGVRPGAWLKNPPGSNCTAGFVFASHDVPSSGRADGNVYLSTAAHCLTGQLVSTGGTPAWELTWPEGTGPIETAVDADLDPYAIGRWVYAAHSSVKDFALIQLFDGIAYDARVCALGGPSRPDSGAALAGPIPLRFYGQGAAVSLVSPDRTVVAQNVPTQRGYALGSVVFGDSGSPVLAPDGQAIGLVTDIAASVALDDPGTMSYSRIAPQLDRARTVLHKSLRLVTASS